MTRSSPSPPAPPLYHGAVMSRPRPRFEFRRVTLRCAVSCVRPQARGFPVSDETGQSLRADERPFSISISSRNLLDEVDCGYAPRIADRPPRHQARVGPGSLLAASTMTTLGRSRPSRTTRGGFPARTLSGAVPRPAHFAEPIRSTGILAAKDQSFR
jgi:hypothetical protein